MKIAITPNCQKLYSNNGFRSTEDSNWYAVEVFRDWDENRLIKTFKGKAVSATSIPRNWTDTERNDGRKWRITQFTPCRGFFSRAPKIEVTFEDSVTGVTMTKRL